MRTVPRGPSAELLWGHGACEGCSEISGVYACGLCQGDLRRSSCGATKRVKGVPKRVAGTRADCGPSAEPLWGHEACE
eukprot:3646515-Pyramimonas_sp.AAC.1